MGAQMTPLFRKAHARGFGYAGRCPKPPIPLNLLNHKYILIMKFINRTRELEFLQRKYTSSEPELIIFYGRRRIGKTELLNEFSKNKKTLYFLGRAESKEDTLRRFNLFLMEYFNDISLARSPLREWDSFFEYLAEKSKKRLVLIIDEFPLIVEKFPEILSILQDKWDTLFKKSKIMLVLCGSSISMMEKYTLDYKSPLYGRRTGQWMVDRLDIVHLKEFFPQYSFEDILTVYSAIDTIPGYIVKFDSHLPVWKNIENKIFSKGEYLYEEVEILLREELRDPSNYMSILSAIAGGLTAFNEIYTKTGLDKSLLSKYLSVLEKLGIIEKNQPVTSTFKRKLKAIGAKYSIKDNFFDFWFRFVYTNLSELEKGNSAAISKSVQKDFPEYLGTKFERAVIGLIPHLGIFQYTKIGKWWHKEQEIDIVAVNENTNEILFCECKWKNKKADAKVLEELLDKAKFVDWNTGKRKEYFMFVSKNGFTMEAEEFARRNNFLLFSLKNLEKVLQPNPQDQNTKVTIY